MKILSSEKLSDHRYKTAEGYLICTDAIIARTGEQEYLENELDPTTDSSKIVKCIRPEEEVFSPETIASFENKPFTFEHPTEDVTPENYHELSTGFVRDVHRDGNHLVANIVVTDPKAIAAIENHEIEEVSCGYDCRVVKEGDHYVQRMIRGNHVALCRKGRAGDARIVDSAINDGFYERSRMTPHDRKQLEAMGERINVIYDWFKSLGDKVYKEKFFKRMVEQLKQKGYSYDEIRKTLNFAYAANVQYYWVGEVFGIQDSVDDSIKDSKYVEFNGQTCKLLNPQAKPYGKVNPRLELPDGRIVETYWDLIKFKDSVKDSRKVYYIYNDDNDNWGPFNSVAEARQKIRELKKFDKEQNNPFDEVYRIEAELEDCDVNDAVTYSFNKAKEYRGFDINAMMADVKSEAMKVINGQQKFIHLVMKTSALTTSFVGDKDAYFLEIDISTEERIEEILLTVYFAHPTDIGRPNYYSSAGTYKASLKSATKALLKGDLDRFLNEVKSKILQLASKEDFTPNTRLYKDSVDDSAIQDDEFSFTSIEPHSGHSEYFSKKEGIIADDIIKSAMRRYNVKKKEDWFKDFYYGKTRDVTAFANACKADLDDYLWIVDDVRPLTDKIKQQLGIKDSVNDSAICDMKIKDANKLDTVKEALRDYKMKFLPTGTNWSMKVSSTPQGIEVFIGNLSAIGLDPADAKRYDQFKSLEMDNLLKLLNSKNSNYEFFAKSSPASKIDRFSNNGMVGYTFRIDGKVKKVNDSNINDKVYTKFDSVLRVKKTPELERTFDDFKGFMMRKFHLRYLGYNGNEANWYAFTGEVKDLETADAWLRQSNVYTVKDSNINDAYMPLEHISKYFDAWGWPGPSQLQNIVNHYVLSKDEAEQLFKNHYSKSDYQNLKFHDSIRDGFYSIRRKVEDYLNGYAVVLGRDWARYGVKAEVERWYGEKRDAVYAKDSLILNDGLDFVVVDCGLKKRLYDSNSLLDVLSNAWRKQNAD